MSKVERFYHPLALFLYIYIYILVTVLLSGIVLFSKLNSLWLFRLPKLKNIYWSPLLLPSLGTVRIVGCPNLKKLPLSSQSGRQGEDELIIRYGEEEWIEGVEWEDEATKTRFLSSSSLEY